MNQPCEKMREAIAEYVLALANDEQSLKVQEHLAECSECKVYADELLSERRMLVDFGNALDAGLEARQMKVIEALNAQPAKTLRLNSFWRKTMNSKITKLAAAAAIIIAVLLGIYATTGSFDGSTRAYAMSDLPELLYSARTIHMKMRVYYQDNITPDKVIPSDGEALVDLQNERWRKVTSNVSMDQNGTRISQVESICEGGGFELNLNQDTKAAAYRKLGDYGRKRDCRQIAQSILYMTCGKPEILDLYRIVGTEQINGQLHEIWELVIENDDSFAMNVKMQTWLNPANGDVDHVIIWRKIDGDWFKMADITTLDLNIDVSDESFQMSVPNGYELINTLETAYPNSIGGVSCGTDDYMVTGHILFALNDGSMISCWSSKNYKTKEPQADYFIDLEFGGQLPELPCVVDGLKTSYNGQDVIYTGSHLGFTQKNGQFYEWAFYTTSHPIERRMAHILPYQLLYKTNGKEDASCKLAMQPDMPIENALDFDDLVIGAMKEFSDDGIVPDLTYEYVLDLSEQLSISIK